MPGNSRTFRRRSTAIKVKGGLEGALLSVASFEAQYHLYGSCGLGNIIPGLVSTPDGDFSQVVAGVEQEVRHVSLADSMPLDDEADDGMDVEGSAVCTEGSAEVARKEEKKKKQTAVWQDELIPAMVQPYLKLLRDTESLRLLPPVRNVASCAGCTVGQMMEVYCMFFDRKCFASFQLVWHADNK